MINNTTAILVALFFFHGAIASFLVGSRLWIKKDRTIKFFGIALVLNSLAFLTWSLIALNHLNNLRIMAAAAAIFLILALYTFLLAGIQHLEDETSYKTALLVGAFAAMGLFILRTFISPAHIIITNNGFLLFNLSTAVKAAYVLAISASLIPAANAVAGKFNKTILSHLFRACFTTLAIGGIILATTSDTTLVLLDGIVMTIAFLLLWTTVLSNGKKSLAKID